MQRIRHSELFADANSRRILNFAMPWHGASPLRRRIVIDAVFGSLAEQHTAVLH